MPFAVYKASAGSGKTYALVREYLRIVLAEPREFRNVLAITFTNKVANEMKERVLTALEELSKGSTSENEKIKDHLLPDLIRRTGLQQEQVAIRAGEALSMILHNYSDFAIGTMDSFSHRLIRAFAHDFGLSIGFNVELDSEELLSTAVDLLMDRVGDDPDLTQLLVRFLETRMDEERGWNIRNILIEFASNLLDEEGQLRLDELQKLTIGDYRKITELLHSRIRHFETVVEKLAKRAVKIITDADVPVNSFFHSTQGIGVYFAHLADGRMDKLNPNSYVVKTIEEDKWHAGKITPAERSAIDSVKGALQGIYEEIKAERERSMPDYMLYRLLMKTIYPLAVLNEINRVLDEFKKQNNLVHISEFNTRIARIILNEPVPFIYERLGEKFRHILIDEFQDTSAMQWMNFIPLIENGLATGNFSLVVGDGKQAIYRFRNGDVEQFAALPGIPASESNALLQQRESSLRNHYQPVTLSSNYRSRAEIVDFNNKLFGFLAGQNLIGDHAKIYGDHQQEFNPGNTGGFVRIEFLDKGKRNEQDDETPGRIMELVRKLEAEHFRMSDIVVLCRNNKNASAIARHLLLNGVNVVSAESLLLSSSPDVNFLVSFISAVSGMRNPVVEAEIASYLVMHGQHDNTLLTGIFDRIATGKESLEGIINDLGYTITIADLAELPVYDLCEELLRIFGLGAVPDPYVLFFLDAVHQFTTSNTPGLKDFLAWWENQREKRSIIVPEGIDAVRVMTIHKAKGLQFPVVIYPYATDTMRTTRNYLWIDIPQEEKLGLTLALLKTEAGIRETRFSQLYETEASKSMLDLLNILYVALTRPEERLYIFTRMPAEGGNQASIPDWLSTFLKNESIWKDDERVYTFGHEIPRSNVQTIATAVTEMKSMISSGWRSRVTIRMRAPEFWDLEGEDEKSRWGNRIHLLLSKINTKDETPEVLEEAMISGLIMPEEKEQLEKIFGTLFAMPFVERLFSDEVRVMTEAEILLPDGEFFRPDRVVVDGEDTFIVDYKTGRPNERHKSQLNRYSGLLTEMGYKNITRVLIYLESKPVIMKF